MNTVLREANKRPQLEFCPLVLVQNFQLYFNQLDGIKWAPTSEHACRAERRKRCVEQNNTQCKGTIVKMTVQIIAALR